MRTLAITERPSPNHGPRRDGAKPSLIVIHYTAMESAEAAIARLCDPAAEVSAHYLIASDGEITQMVAEAERAWHAGVGSWHGQSDVNSHSIGVELDNRGDHPFAARQMDALEILLRDVMQRWNISPSGVIGHSDLAPGRKSDPGRYFDWARLSRQGLAGEPSAGPPPERASWDSFKEMARRIGYTAEVSDQDLLRAVRMRFRPHARGALCPADLAPLSLCAPSV